MSTIFKNLLLFSLFSILVFSVAQKATGIVVEITTDKSQYIVGEDILITVKAVNTSGVSQTLSFSSSLQADYTIDGKYRWSSDKLFAQFLTSVEIPAGSSHQWKLTHKSSDFKLDSGTHTISGEVLGYGSAQIAITVTSKITPLVSVRTDKAEYLAGEKINISVTAENPSAQTITLNFSSSYQADYVIDKTYRWSSDKAFTQALTAVVLPSFSTKNWEFAHDTAVNPLSIGAHSIQGEVVGYGSATTTILIKTIPREKFVVGVHPVDGRSDRMFIVSITDPTTIQQARDCYTYGQQNPGDPRCSRYISGRIDSGNGGFNTNWSWHLIPETVRMPEITMELCDGSPNDVERDGVNFDAGIFCPWSSYILALGGQYPKSPTVEQFVSAFTRNLAVGLRGNDVKELQRILASDPLIYPEGLVTGYFGPLTRKAVIRFQEKYASEILIPIGLTKGTGFVGPMTVKKLNKIQQKPQ